METSKAISVHRIVAYAKHECGDKIPLTKEQYEATRKAKGEWYFSKTHEVRDPVTRKLLFSDTISKIVWFEEINLKPNTSRWVCWYGTKHTMNEHCDCWTTFWVSEWKYRQEASARWFQYVQNIPNADKNAIIAHIKEQKAYAEDPTATLHEVHSDFPLNQTLT